MKTTIVAADRIEVSETVGAPINGLPQKSSWSMRPDQAEKMLSTFSQHNEKVSPGDATAIRDAAADFAREKKAREE